MFDHHGGRLYDTKVKGQKAKVKGQGKALGQGLGRARRRKS
jgi:hypothetical protein